MTVIPLLLLVGLCTQAAPPPRAHDAELLRRGDRIVLIGGTYAERCASFGHFEALLYARRPDLELSLRSLAWSADTVALRPRPLNFGDLYTHLERVQPDVLLLCFGMAESFDGVEGRGAFESALDELVLGLAAQRYGGEAPRLVLVSPIPHEDLGAPLPTGEAIQRRRRAQRAYVDAMRAVAEKREVRFVDLFRPVQAWMEQESRQPLTVNGIHLSSFGDYGVSTLLLEGLGVPAQGWSVDVDAASGAVELDGAHALEAQVDRSRVALTFDADQLVPTTPFAGRFPRKARDADGRAVPAWGSFVPPAPLVRVRNLEPGNYALELNGRRLPAGSAEQWASGKGIGLRDRMDPVCEALRDKNRWFFHRYRPVNGEYVFGRRAEPFGVVNFPEEMRRLDALVDEHEAEIAAGLASARRYSLKLVRVP